MADEVGLARTYPDMASRAAAVTGVNVQFFQGADLGASVWSGGGDAGITIENGTGARHGNVDPGADPASVAMVLNPATDGIRIDISHVTLRGLTVYYTVDPGASVQAIRWSDGASGNAIVDGNMGIFKCDNASGSIIGINVAGFTASSKIVNNFFKRYPGFTTSSVFRGFNGAGGTVGEFSYNTTIGDGTSHSQRGWNMTGTTSVNGYGNLCGGFASDFYDFVRTNGDANMSSDSTGDSGFQNINLADVLIDPANNWVAKGAALSAGIDRAVEALLLLDGAGNSRPPWDIGAFATAEDAAAFRSRSRGRLRRYNRLKHYQHKRRA